MTDRIQPLTITRAALIGTVVAVLVAGACVRLGIWQLSRLAQRDARNQLLAQRINLPPVPLEASPNDTSGLLYRRVLVAGRFDHERTIVLPGRALRGAPGVHVLTPVLLGAGHSAVLVNRGWEPAADGARVNFDSLHTASEIRLIGLVVPFPGSGRGRTPSAPTNGDTSFRRAWFSPDPGALRRQFPYALLDLAVQALPDSSAPRFPVRLQPPVLDRGPHLGYAIQWFSFAAIALIGWITLMLRKGEVRR